jgi:3-oxoacyl-[acyl-carrier protein] reductase
MMARGFGRVVNIVSRSVKIPQPELGLSNGARSGLVGFVAGLARQTVARNVTINNLLPGIFDSDAQRAHIRGMLEETGKSFDELWRARGEANPAKRYGRPGEL